TQSRITVSSRPPTVIMLVGLQGAGKTTTAAKLAHLLVKQNKRPMLVAADVYRPAAIKQLQVLGEQLDLPVFALTDNTDPVEIAKRSIEYAISHTRDMVIIDTAGRLHINEELMQELKNIKQTVKPHEILLVVDAMTGQDAVTVAESFNNDLGIDGVILTKLDGDARGGAALSVKAVTGRPIKFAGMGEKLDALEPFHPDRMASRILGMGDVLSLIEKAETSINFEQAKEMEKKLRKEDFTLDDFLEQLQQVRKLGPLDQILGMLPGMGNMKKLKDVEIDEKELSHTEAIIRSMTKKERRDPAIINGSRRKRIAVGSGTRVQDVNKLLKQFVEAKKMMKRFQEMQKSGKKNPLSGFKLPFMR
ncbi:MAG TPA: signal recognition particle protein, partial [Negativicutes bacterium]